MGKRLKQTVAAFLAMSLVFTSAVPYVAESTSTENTSSYEEELLWEEAPDEGLTQDDAAKENGPVAAEQGPQGRETDSPEPSVALDASSDASGLIVDESADREKKDSYAHIYYTGKGQMDQTRWAETAYEMSQMLQSFLETRTEDFAVNVRARRSDIEMYRLDTWDGYREGVRELRGLSDDAAMEDDRRDADLFLSMAYEPMSLT